MTEVEKLIDDISKLKENLNKLIETKNFNLQDQEVIQASKELNKHITKYSVLINSKL